MDEFNENIDVTFAKDKSFIQNEVITQLPSGEYCKYSRVLKAICVTNMTKQQYIKFWTNKYTKYINLQKQIKQICEQKLTEGLLPINDMIQLVKNSKDVPKEKQKMLKLLGSTDK